MTVFLRFTTITQQPLDTSIVLGLNYNSPLAVRPAEIIGIGVLTGIDNLAANVAGAGEEVVEHISLVPTDGPLQHGGKGILVQGEGECS